MAARALPRILFGFAMIVAISACSPNVDELRQSRDIEGLIAALDAEHPAEVRADAAEALGELGANDAVTALVAMLSDPDPGLRRVAAAAIGELTAPSAVADLLAALEDDDEAVRAAARDAIASLLAELPAGALDDVFVDALEHDSVIVRLAAVEALGALRAGHVADAVARLVDDPDSEVRVAAVGTLGLLGDVSAFAVLIAALDHEDAGVRRAAGGAIAALLDQVQPSETSALLLEALGSESVAVRVLAATELGRVGDVQALVPLLAAQSDPESDVQAAARSSVDALTDSAFREEAVAVLLAALDDERTDVAGRAEAQLITMLGLMQPETGLGILVALDAPDEWLALALGVPVDALATEMRLLGLQIDSLEEIVLAAADVAAGGTLPGARAYAPSAGFHPAVIIEAVDEFDDFDDFSPWFDVRDRWAPSAIRFTELVVIEDEIAWTALEECLYNGPSIIRYRGSQTIRVLSAVDGRLVAEQTFQGSDPRFCAPTEAYSLTELYGEDPDLSAAIPWLESLINPP